METEVTPPGNADGYQNKGLAREAILSTLEGSVVQDNGEEGIIDMDLAVISDVAEFSEFVHEQIDPRAGGTNHLSQHLLR